MRRRRRGARVPPRPPRAGDKADKGAPAPRARVGSAGRAPGGGHGSRPALFPLPPARAAPPPPGVYFCAVIFRLENKKRGTAATFGVGSRSADTPVPYVNPRGRWALPGRGGVDGEGCRARGGALLTAALLSVPQLGGHRSSVTGGAEREGERSREPERARRRMRAAERRADAERGRAAEGVGSRRQRGRPGGRAAP